VMSKPRFDKNGKNSNSAILLWFCSTKLTQRKLDSNCLSLGRSLTSFS
jgi:hypothetical protein